MTGRIRLALLGHPVAHSRSPAIHRAALAAAGLEGEYQAIDADSTRLSQAVDELREGTLTGINVTMPLKGAAAGMADELTPLAEKARSVNTLRCRRGRIEANSTDAAAFEAVFADPRFPLDAPLLILGAGDTARAALAAVGGRRVHISARSEQKASVLVEEYGLLSSIPWGEAMEGALLVNSTPLGMHGERLPDAVEAAAAGLIDLPYGDQPTPATTRALASGLPLADGVEFLVRQARASFRWWTGEDVDFETLLEAARNV